MKPYFLYDGLRELAGTLVGDEHIYLGVRPYAFHAGNAITMVVYPLLLCQEMQKLGKTPRFTFFVFINDWEQDRLAGPDTKTYPFNIFPLNTTFQHATNQDNLSVNIVDYWEKVIVTKIRSVQESFPDVQVTPIRNSQMKTNPVMKRCVLFTLQHPQAIADILRARTTTHVLNEPLAYALAVCPHCLMVKGTTRVVGEDSIVHFCSHCQQETSTPYEHFDYWFYHKPLAVPRLEICNIDLCITGFDHYNEGDYLIRQDLIALLGSSAKLPKTLYAPTLLGKNGEVMGKSKGNAEAAAVTDLVKVVTDTIGSEKLQLPADLTTFSMSETMADAPSSPAV